MIPSAWVDNLLAVLLKYLCFIALQLLNNSFRYLRLYTVSYRGKTCLFYSECPFCFTHFAVLFLLISLQIGVAQDALCCYLKWRKKPQHHPHCKQNSFHIYRVSEQTKELWSLSASFNKGLVLIIECFSYY